MTAWKVAESLDQLLAQLNTLAPRRSKTADGSIGDARHQAEKSSDHNPRLIAGANLVTARDFTHDPDGGLDCQHLADALRQGRDPRVKYVIWNRRIMAGAGGPNPWAWRPYSGPSPHTEHVHLSVVADARCRDDAPWKLPGFAAKTYESLPTLRQGDSGPAVASLQRFLNAEPWSPPLPALAPDGDYGPKTVAVVRAAQEQCGVTGPAAVGTPVGPRTKAAFWARGWRG
jgi:hypothetical protein